VQELNVTTPAIATREVQVRGLRVRYQVVGSGEPVILVHGLSGSSRWWMRNIPALAPHYRLYLVDLPGFGAMRRHRRHFVLAEAASWLLAWMEALDLHQAHLVGHSMGGYICVRLAAARPAAVRRLVLVAPAGMPTGRSLPGYFVPLLLSGRYAAPRFLPVLLYDSLRAGPRTVLRAGMALLAEDLRVHLAAITAPTLLVWGEHDPLVPRSISEILRQEICDSRLLILEGAGHVPMFDRPREFNAAILHFLADEPVGE
jgi:pimeloyl-ACP methyl ester carboxylesterase